MMKCEILLSLLFVFVVFVYAKTLEKRDVEYHIWERFERELKKIDEGPNGGKTKPERNFSANNDNDKKSYRIFVHTEVASAKPETDLELSSLTKDKPALKEFPIGGEETNVKKTLSTDIPKRSSSPTDTTTELVTELSTMTEVAESSTPGLEFVLQIGSAAIASLAGGGLG